MAPRSWFLNTVDEFSTTIKTAPLVLRRPDASRFTFMEAIALIFTLIGLSTLSLAGFQLCSLIASALNEELNPWLKAGAGFFVAAALLIQWLSHAPIPLSTASWSVVFISALVSLPLLQMTRRPVQTTISGLLRRKKLRTYLPYFLLITLIATHLLFVLANNLTRDIFPWDAFTTWMYRAKVWVLNDEMLNFQGVNQWLQSGGLGYALPASHYPSSVSAVAAFSSALSSGWNDQLASVPWFFAMLAIGSMMFGLCRQSGLAILPSLVGLYLLISLPIVGMHGILAGYADLWMLGTSGMGLAALMLWTQKKHRGALVLGAVLLLIGSCFKTEGWIWLGMGMLFILVTTLWRKRQYAAFLGVMAILFTGFHLESVQLGSLGRWGIHEAAIHVGPLGQYLLRPYNALPIYFDMIFLRGNFHLLGVLYMLALGLLTFTNWRTSVAHWLMCALILCSQWIIFGLSSYSLYAETGTALNRLLLQFLPVFVLTITVAWQTVTKKLEPSSLQAGPSAKGQNSQSAIVIGVLMVSLVAPAFILLDWSGNKSNDQEAYYTPDLLEPVLGKFKRLNNGNLAFTDTPGPVAVAKVRLKSPGSQQPQYVIPDASISAPSVASFYWVNENDRQVNAYSLDMSGPIILDMKSVPAFWQKPVTEMGYLVKKQALRSVQLNTLAVSNTIRPQLAPALMNHWLTPNAISQRSINMVDTHSPSPISWTGWAGLAALLGTVLATTIIAITRLRFPDGKLIITAFLALLWLASDLLSLRQLHATLRPLMIDTTQTEWHMNTGMGEHLPQIAELITATSSEAVGVVAVNLDQSGEFYAQKLPLILAPQPAVAVSLTHATNLARTWQGYFILFSSNKALLLEEASRLSAQTRFQISRQGDDFVLLALEDQ